MNLEEKLKKQQYKEIWQQYCGFLDLSMDGYMKIQRRLMEEQIRLWSNCGLGQSILKGKHPSNLDEFRKMVPLTTYEDYADVLLTKQPDMLPGNPVIWIQTTWEGGKHPIKVAPYTRSMLDTYRNNVTACLILSTSKEKGSFDVAATDKFLYALAPLPFATGLFPLALGEEIGIEFLPAVDEAVNMSFSERNKLGFMVAGTDNLCYKDDLEELWGIRPMELFAGTEPSIMGTETWTRKGMYFFPDTAFYEFITEKDMMRNYDAPSYIPPTYLMDEVRPGEKYELVFTILKGGAFARYRCGDMYRCVGLENREDETRIPRFEYVDRVPWIIDIAGFTRISENGIRSVISLSKLPITNWVATKEYNEQNRPYLHMYVELEQEALLSNAMSANILKDLLSTYFKYIDQDYRDLKKILGMDPLQVTIFTCGTFEAYEKKTGKKIHQMNPSHYDMKELLDVQEYLNKVR